jgi:hypothetical protein
VKYGGLPTPQENPDGNKPHHDLGNESDLNHDI